ncbi:MAG: bifunctional indole-3-glycerol phosphate synthase/phosphoribosylanthranilate isomerase [Saprospiraceae bacterium]
MDNILAKIVAQKRLEIKALYEKQDFHALEKAALKADQGSEPEFYQALASSRKENHPFFITEFKRKSPSEGWINREADLPKQVLAYAQAGAGAISVLTDSEFFGGSYADLALAASTLKQATFATGKRPLLLQKDFILDPIQIYLAKTCGADLILLIAAILEPEQLEALREIAEAIGLGVLVEVHDQAELDRIQHLNFPVLGINNRDLKTFRTSLNRVNVVSRAAGDRFIIAESGVRDYRDFQVVRNADGFLIGTSLMRNGADPETTFSRHFAANGRLLFKACGMRIAQHLQFIQPDYLGINFSPRSRRQPDEATRSESAKQPDFPSHLVAVFYQNTEAEIRAILHDYPFKSIQLYAEDVTPAFVRSLSQKVILAAAVRGPEDLTRLEDFAGDVDFFILDGALPGSGQAGQISIPVDFPYPFLLAGGLHLENLDRVLAYKNCIGVDIASGLETAGQVDAEKIQLVSAGLSRLSLRRPLAAKKIAPHGATS